MRVGGRAGAALMSKRKLSVALIDPSRPRAAIIEEGLRSSGVRGGQRHRRRAYPHADALPHLHDRAIGDDAQEKRAGKVKEARWRGRALVSADAASYAGLDARQLVERPAPR